jgi:hypothetical protein
MLLQGEGGPKCLARVQKAQGPGGVQGQSPGRGPRGGESPRPKLKMLQFGTPKLASPDSLIVHKGIRGQNFNTK